MAPRTPRAPGLPFGGGLNLVLAAGAAYFVREHGQGRHGRPHLLCPLCWLNKIAPDPGASGRSDPAEPPQQALPARRPGASPRAALTGSR